MSIKNPLGTIQEQSRELVTGEFSVAAVVTNGAAWLLALLMVFPLYYLFASSGFHSGQMYSSPPKLTPGAFAQYIANYTQLFATTFPRNFLNSLIYAVGSVTGVVCLATLAGYAYAMFEFRGRSVLFYVTLASLAIPYQLLAIPLYNIMNSLNLLNSYVGLILPTVAGPIGVFFMKQNLEASLIEDMLRSARIDGASEGQIFYHIVWPLARPGMAALAILVFLWRMQDLFWPLIVLQSEEMRVGTMFLESHAQSTANSPAAWELLLPAAFIMTIPTLLLFLFAQKHFVKGLMAGSVK